MAHNWVGPGYYIVKQAREARRRARFSDLVSHAICLWPVLAP